MIKKSLLLLILSLGIVSTAAFAQDDTGAEALADHKTACLAAIDNIGKIGDGFAMRSMISMAKASLNICQSKDDMRRTMTALRAGVVSYLQTVKTFTDGQVYTGLVGNHSFDTGDMSLWYCLSFDLSQISLTDITNAMSGGDVSGLVNAVKVNEWSEDTKAIENEGSNAVQGGDQKYFLNSKQLLMQPILGLPAGIYRFSAKVACNSGFLGLNKVHLCALVVPTSTVQEVIGDIIGDNANWSELLGNFDLIQYMGPFLQSGKLYTGTANGKNLDTFSDGQLRFIIDEGDIVVIGINAGMVPFIGTDLYRADNLQLTGLRAADGILTPAKADLAEALQGKELVEANYNADLEGTQPAFTYDKTLTVSYNNALLSAQDKYENDKLADMLTQSDLNNLDGIDAKLKNHYQAEIQALNKAKEAFDRQAFIAPSADEPFNILMKDNWISLTNKWTGNAVSINEDMTMRFSQKPGESVFALAFSFERASRTYTNQLLAFVSDSRHKYYLGKEDDDIVLTTEPSEALVITAVPSYTEEGEIHLMSGDMYLGTSSSDNTLIATDEGTMLRPTRTGLSVVPASGMEFAVDSPMDWNVNTLILPFDAKIPEGLLACTVTGINADLPYIEAEAATSIRANVPYLIMSVQGNYVFSGVPNAILPSYGESLLIGRYTPYTTGNGNEYKMTKEDGYSMFRQMDGQTIAENECYLKSDTPSDIIFISRTDAATGISLTSILSKDKGSVYNLSGQGCAFGKQKGIYIIKGKKFVIR